MLSLQLQSLLLFSTIDKLRRNKRRHLRVFNHFSALMLSVASAIPRVLLLRPLETHQV